jgi:replicative DNA helicase
MNDNPSNLPEKYRLLPQDAPAEQGVLCSLLIDPPRVFAMCEERGVTREWFHIPAHALVFEAMSALWKKKTAGDFITLTTALSDAGTLEQVGGAAFITHLFTYLPTAANASHYLSTVEEKFTLRRIIEVCTRHAAQAYDPLMPAGDLLDAVQAAIMALNRPGADLTDCIRHIRHGLVESVERMELAYRNRGHLQGLPSGFIKLDDMTMGFKPGQLVFVAGRPAMGKSAFLCNIARAIAQSGPGVLFFTLEMSEAEQCDRLLCTEAEMSLQKIRDGFFSEAEMTSRIPGALQRLSGLEIYIDETPAISIQELRARARRYLRLHPGIKALVIDYVQLMQSHTRRARDNRAVELGEISGGLKNLAKELKVTVFAGAQLNRDADDGRPPKLSQFRESGALEQDCDIAILLHRPEYYFKLPEDKAAAAAAAGMSVDDFIEHALAILAKHRNGPTDPPVPLRFIKKWTRFDNASVEQTGDQHRTNDSRKKQAGARRQQEFQDHMKKEE